MNKRKPNEMEMRLYLGELVKAFLGASRRIKCLEDEGDIRFFRYASLLLENLDIEHPVYQYIISVSQEFRKRFCAGAADDLLYYIHSWTKMATDLNEMGIPLEDVIKDMKVTINECIGHIESKKVNISQSRDIFGQHTIKLSSGIDSDIMKGVRNLKGFSGMDEKDHDIDKICLVSGTNDAELENRIGRLFDDYVEISPENYTSPFKHIQDKLNDNIRNDTGKQIGNSSENEDLSVNADGIEFIHLKMKNIKQDVEDCDDTSWFFDDIEDDKAKGMEHGYNTMTDQTDGSEDVGIKTDGNGDKCISLESEDNSDDSGAIIGDIENLKIGIENDIKRLQDSRGKILKEKVNASTINMNKDETDSDEFDSCFDFSDLAFDEYFDKSQDSNNKRTGKKEKISETKSDFDEEDGFMTVALKFRDIKLKKNRSKERSDSSPYSVYSGRKENCLDFKVDRTKGIKGSFDVKLQTCSKDYLRIKEMLKDRSVNDGIVGNGEEQSIKDVMSGNESEEILESENMPQKDGKNIVSNNYVEIDEEVGNTWSNYVCPEKNGEMSFHKDQLQKINSILGSLGKEDKKDCNKLKVSSLKFRSRHFQDEEIEETDVIDNSKLESDTRQLYSDVNNGNNDNRSITDGENISTSRNSRTLKQNSESSSDKLHTDFLSDSHLFVIEQVGDVEKNPHILNLEDVNNMLRDIDIAKRENDSSVTSLETIPPQLKRGNDTDFTHFSKFCAMESCKSNTANFDVKSVKQKFDINLSRVGKQLPLKECKTGVLNQSNIFLRSRHMNTETDQGNILDMSQEIPNGTSPETESDETKHIPDDGNSSIDELPHNGEDIEAEARSLVFGLNYNGDENINKAACDIILKQSKKGNLRLNIDLIDCYTSIGTSRDSHEVIDGVMVQTSVEKVMMMQKFPQRQYRALLVNGDLTMTFRHKGYKPLKVKQFTSVERFECGKIESDCWQDDVIDILKELRVDMLLVKGNISEGIVSICEQHDIVTIETVPYKQLTQLSEATETDMVTYVTLATEDNVCNGISVLPLQKSWCNEKTHSWRDKVDTVISLTENNPQTVILHGASMLLVELKEQELWNLLQLISSVLHYGYLVQGAGQTEEECAKFLNDRAEIMRRDQISVSGLKTQCVQQVVTESVTSSFHDYSRLFQDNFTEAGLALECFKSKIETWKLALQTVAIVTNIDSYIITGITEEEAHKGTL